MQFAFFSFIVPSPFLNILMGSAQVSLGWSLKVWTQQCLSFCCPSLRHSACSRTHTILTSSFYSLFETALRPYGPHQMKDRTHAHVLSRDYFSKPSCLIALSRPFSPQLHSASQQRAIVSTTKYKDEIIRFICYNPFFIGFVHLCDL